MSFFPRMRGRTAFGAGALLLALAGSALALGSAPAAAGALPAFGDCAELTRHFRDLAMPHVAEHGFGEGHDDRWSGGGRTQLGEGMPEPTVALSSGSTSPGSAPTVAVGPGESGTNVQEAGVDEPDTAKTDGKVLVALDRGKLRLYDVAGTRPAALGTLEFGEGRLPQELLLAGNRLLVTGTTHVEHDDDRRWYPTWISLVDLTERTAPRVVATQEISGQLVSARLVGGIARVVVSSSPYLTFRGPAASSTPTGHADTLARNRGVVQQAGAEDWLPARRVLDGAGRATAASTPLVDCDDVRYPVDPSGLGVLSVQTLDPARDDAFTAGSATAVLAAGQLVYSSPTRLYVATTQQQQPAPGEAKTGQRSSIHSFDIADPARTAYLGSGTVAGYIPGRWAMSEHAGDLRVVTTTGDPWVGGEAASASSVLVLRQQAATLAEAGRVDGLGRGERVYAVRWFDELAAVVTYRQIDQLYLVDLTVPQVPVLRGELKVPGFSEYLHPIGENRLLGVGQGETARGSGLQVSTFDVADLDKPTRTDAVQFGSSNSSSVVQTDPRRFAYLPEQRTVVLPAEIPGEWTCAPGKDCAGLTEGMACKKGLCRQAGNDKRFHGLLALRVAADGTLTETGRWRSRGAYAGSWSGGRVLTFVPLPAGRVVALDARGVTILDAVTMSPLGSTPYAGN